MWLVNSFCYKYVKALSYFNRESHLLTPTQSDFIGDLEANVYKVLEETPLNRMRFAKTVCHVL